MILEENSKLVMIGDSITDCGRARTEFGKVGDGEGRDGFGNGYVNLINAIITSKTPELKLRIINKGISGNTVRDLKDRWQKDVLNMNPDYLAIKIGINDVWRRYDRFLIPEIHIHAKEYEDTLIFLIDQVKGLKKLILITPYLIDDNLNNSMRKDMDELGDVVKRLASKNNAILVDTQKAFDKYLEVNHSFTLAGDQVHPNTIGHMIIARAFLAAIDYSF
ncbi:MAG: GDSL family lipase [Planctomycetota bacterium]|nr:MAG: GDSL family lipase [Planctomycetota bacterium]